MAKIIVVNQKQKDKKKDKTRNDKKDYIINVITEDDFKIYF